MESHDSCSRSGYHRGIPRAYFPVREGCSIPRCNTAYAKLSPHLNSTLLNRDPRPGGARRRVHDTTGNGGATEGRPPLGTAAAGGRSWGRRAASASPTHPCAPRREFFEGLTLGPPGCGDPTSSAHTVLRPSSKPPVGKILWSTAETTAGGTFTDSSPHARERA